MVLTYNKFPVLNLIIHVFYIMYQSLNAVHCVSVVCSDLGSQKKFWIIKVYGEKLYDLLLLVYGIKFFILPLKYSLYF